MNVHQVCQAQLVYELSHARMGFTSAKRAVTGMFGQLAQTGKYGFLKIGHEGMTLGISIVISSATINCTSSSQLSTPTMSEELKKGDEVSWNWGSGQPCTFHLDPSNSDESGQAETISRNGSRYQRR